ncbi:MAG: hypothetical protein KKD44_00045 [Proteobacteria bacterium]|nr:hypothetical protein [Pseudomonadota bacterium]
MNKIVLFFLMVTLFPSTVFSDSLINRFSAEEGFVIHLPFGWEQIPGKALKEYSPDVSYHYGFQERPGGQWFQNTPYMLILINDEERISESEVKDIDTMVAEEKKAIQKVIYSMNLPIKDFYIDDAHYDEENKIFYSTMVFIQTDAQSVTALSALILTENGHIGLTCYIDEKDSPSRYYDLFHKMVENIQLDDELVFVPRFSDNFKFMDRFKKMSFKPSPKIALLALVFCLSLWGLREKFK